MREDGGHVVIDQHPYWEWEDREKKILRYVPTVQNLLYAGSTPALATMDNEERKKKLDAIAQALTVQLERMSEIFCLESHNKELAMIGRERLNQISQRIVDYRNKPVQDTANPQADKARLRMQVNEFYQFLLELIPHVQVASPNLTQGMRVEIMKHIMAGNKLNAVKLYKDYTGMSLMDSKVAVEKMMEDVTKQPTNVAMGTRDKALVAAGLKLPPSKPKAKVVQLPKPKEKPRLRHRQAPKAKKRKKVAA